MQQKLSTIALLLCLLAAFIYSMMSLQSSPKPTHKEHAGNLHADAFPQKLLAQDTIEQGAQSTDKQSTLPIHEKTGIIEAKQVDELPISIKLIGTNTQPPMQSLLESGGRALQYTVGDLVFSQAIQLIRIDEKQVRLAYNNKTFDIDLLGPNLLQQQIRRATADPYKMTPKQIGNRPKIIEHIVSLSPTDYIAGGMIAAQGMNPALFQQAGLKQDDIIMSINGYKVDSEDKLDSLQTSIEHSDTIVFEVIRRGRAITLYLDIPSEALTIAQ